MSTYEITKDHAIALEDGTVLRGDIYRQTRNSTAPVVLFRTPYAKERLSNEIFTPFDALESGFNAYVQDIRGFGRSEGVPNFVDWTHENQDTYETVNAIIKETWCSGDIAIGGTSFLGMIAISSLERRHSAVRAIFPSMVAVNPFDLQFRQPWIRFEEVLVWLLQVSLQKAMRMKGGDFSQLSAAEKAAFNDLNNLPSLFSNIENNGLPAYMDELEGGLVAHILSGGMDPFPSLEKSLVGAVPALFLTGWYDTFSNATIAIAEAWKEARHEENDTSLIVGPWHHSNQLVSNIGQVNFGPKATGAAINVSRKHSQFLRSAFNADKPDNCSTEYELFGDHWQDEAVKSCGLSLEAHLSKADGESLSGVLVPSYGGQVHFTGGGTPGPIDQSPLIRRDDVLYCETEPFMQSVSVSTPVEIRSSLNSQNLGRVYVKLVVKNLFGEVLPVQEAIVEFNENTVCRLPRVRFRVSKGWRLGVIISTTSYPRYLSTKPGIATDISRQSAERFELVF